MLSRCCRQHVFLHECSHDILQKYIGFDYLLSTVASWNLAGELGRTTYSGLSAISLVLQGAYRGGFLGLIFLAWILASLDVGLCLSHYTGSQFIVILGGFVPLLHFTDWVFPLQNLGDIDVNWRACQFESNSWWSCSG